MESKENMDSDLNEDYSPLHNAGWADTMKKILKANKPRRKKTVVLAKAKKLSCLKPTIVKQETNASAGEPDSVIRKSDWISIGRMKPNPLDRNKEKNLQKITVRGVVCLYNAVNQHQKNMTSNTNTLKQDKQLQSINKQMFLDILRKGSGSSGSDKLKHETKIQQEVKVDNDQPDDDSSTWSVLKNDFMSGRKWKNWDKSNSDHEEIYD